MKTILKVFSEKDHLRNAIVPLSLGAQRIVFLTREDADEKDSAMLVFLFRKYLQAEILFVRINVGEEKEKICALFQQYPDAEIDMSGSRYLLLLLFEEALLHHSSIWYYDETDNNVKNFGQRKQIKKAFSLQLEDMIFLAGGRFMKQLHPSPDKNEGMKRIVCQTMQKMKNCFPSFLSALSSIVKTLRAEKREDNGSYYLRDITLQKLSCLPLFQELQNLGLFRLQGNHFSFYNSYVEEMFEVGGIWLESYVYLCLKESGIFSEVKMSAAIDFSSKNKGKFPVTCEIDVLAIRDNRMFFISCKSNKVDRYALNEIALHNLYFGNERSSAALATLEDVTNKNAPMCAKARELNVCLLDKKQLLNQPAKTLWESTQL